VKALLKNLIAVLLLINGIGAVYGGGNLITYPDGSSLQLSLDWLRHTPFHDYFIPGIILFVANGLFSILIFISMLFNLKNYSRLVIFQGVILSGWIVIQIFLIQTIYFLHIIMGSIGLTLFLLGILQMRKENGA